ncbi:MAG: hypothetical protein GX593_03755 [Actinomycetales bacterium]|nr:hypothetical protein [Actinomycetales bacterium]
MDHIDSTGAPTGGEPDTSRAGELVEDGPTGDQVVDEALEVIFDLDSRPLREHVTAFESVHGALQDRLAEGQR